MTFIPIWQRYMARHMTRHHVTRSLLAPVALGLVASSLVVMPSYGATDDNYGECVTDLTDTGVELNSATASCAGARFPAVLGDCVVDVSQSTGIGAVNALQGCERSRRPDEVADCTIDIHAALLDQPSVNALEHCSRSLLPERYGTCVVELNNVAGLGVNAALDQCIRAGYRPWTTAPRQ
ncbi:hypothetical protein [Leptothoe kymatousa]|uniref:Secreted protein n=1 Tax=Leptothoe kymatousa TAU-MAC 1615 TaxID=2364775 RepID=A0ABS5Y2L6_9CYAN|nr:hypothetical protein [Leptothoe kymatousa]MBT9312083.1 hypothetical protein [Leptothoe kymatousa TAU-MAC 1615]